MDKKGRMTEGQDTLDTARAVPGAVSATVCAYTPFPPTCGSTAQGDGITGMARLSIQLELTRQGQKITESTNSRHFEVHSTKHAEYGGGTKGVTTCRRRKDSISLLSIPSGFLASVSCSVFLREVCTLFLPIVLAIERTHTKSLPVRATRSGSDVFFSVNGKCTVLS